MFDYLLSAVANGQGFRRPKMHSFTVSSKMHIEKNTRRHFEGYIKVFKISHCEYLLDTIGDLYGILIFILSLNKSYAISFKRAAFEIPNWQFIRSFQISIVHRIFSPHFSALLVLLLSITSIEAALKAFVHYPP